MAWEEFSRKGTKGISGDKILDEFAKALRGISKAYQERFSRNPSLVELLYALETVLGAKPDQYVSDGQRLKRGRIVIEPPAEKEASMSIDLEKYEGAYTDTTKPGYHLVQLRGKSNKPGEMVLRISSLQVNHRLLTCTYEIRSDSITDDGARLLIRSVLLDDFCDHYYDAQADEIEFHNLRSKTSYREPMTGPS